MLKTIKRLIPFLLLIGLFSPVTLLFSSAPAGTQEPQKEKVTLQTLSMKEEALRSAEKAGDFKAALEYSKEDDELGDRYFNDEVNSRIARLAAEYDAQKKESEIRLLRKTGENRRKFLALLAVLVVLFLAAAALLYSRFLVRKKANRLLESEEAKYRVLFEQAGDAIFLVDETGYVECNRKAAEMFGVNPGDIVGRTFVDFSPPTQPDGRDSREAGIEWREKVLEGRPRRFPWRFLKRGGSPFDAVVTLAALNVEGRDLFHSIVRDMTETKRFEAERVKSDKLETTAHLAGGIAHDFNTLLGDILENIEQAKSELSPGDEAVSYLSGMEKAARSAVGLANEFCAISEKEFKSIEKDP